MRIGRVLGTVVTPVQHPAYDGRKLLAVRPLNPDLTPASDRMFTAVDRAQAGVGDLVLLMQTIRTSSPRMILRLGQDVVI